MHKLFKSKEHWPRENFFLHTDYGAGVAAFFLIILASFIGAVGAGLLIKWIAS